MARRTSRSSARAMEKKMFSVARFGQWIFLTGVLIAIVSGVWGGVVRTQIIWILGALGLIVGLINMSLKDEVPFLIAVMVLLTSFSSSSLILKDIPVIGLQLVTILTHVVIFVVPAGFLVALKLIYSFAKAEN